MKPSLLNKKKNVAQTMLLSYIAVILICMTVVVLISFKYESVIREENENFSRYLFAGVSQSVREVLYDMRSLNRQIVNDENIQAIADNQLDAGYWKFESTLNGIKSLKAYVDNQKSVSLAFVYLKMSDEVVSRHGILSSNMFYKLYFANCGIPYEDWLSTLRLNERETYLTLNYNHNQERTAAISLVSPTSADKNTVSVIMVNKWEFLRGLDQYEMKNDYDVYIYNSYGRLIIYEKHTEVESPYTIAELERLMEEDKNFIYTVSDTAEVSDWYVATAISKHVLSFQILFMRFFVAALSIVAFIILAFLIKYLMDQNYLPVQRLMSILNLEPHENEYQSLYHSVQKILGENRMLQKEYSQKSVQLRLMYLSQLVQGDSVLLEDSKNYDLQFSHPFFAVLTFYLEDVTTLFAEEPQLSTAERKEHLQFIIRNVFEEKFNTEERRGYVTKTDGLMVCLINLKQEEEGELSAVKQVALDGLSFINTHFHLELTFVLSGIFKGQSGIVKAYTETMEALEYKWRMGISESLLYRDISFDYSDYYLFNLEKESKLVNTIRDGNAEEAQEIVGQIFRILENKSSFSSEYVRFTVLDILSAITKTLAETAGHTADIAAELSIYQDLQNEKLSVVRECVHEYLAEICGGIAAKKAEKSNNRTQKKIQDVMDFVENNFKDPSLNVSSIGDNFDMSPFYLSKLFKEETGVTLIDYLNDCRIRTARELMENSNLSVKDIAEEVGFNHVRTFYRLLKKHIE